MLVLIVDDNRFERESATRLLEQASYRVEGAHDAKSALDAIERDRHPIVVLSWRARFAPDLLRRLRASEGDSHAYVLVALDSNAAGDIAALYAAGADDFMRRPVLREEFLGRVEALARIRKWAAIAEPAGASEAKALEEYAAIRDAGHLAAKDIAEVIGQTVTVAEGWTLEPTATLRGATLPMSLATDKTELRISVLVDEGSCAALGGVLLGDPGAPEEALADVLRELANTAGGAVKRSGLEESLTLTIGLPFDANRPPLPVAGTRCWMATFAEAGVTIAIVGEVQRRENQRISAAKLREGMVLVHDLRNRAGALLASAGTRLTATTAQRVASVLGERTIVEVAYAA